MFTILHYFWCDVKGCPLTAKMGKGNEKKAVPLFRDSGVLQRSNVVICRIRTPEVLPGLDNPLLIIQRQSPSNHNLITHDKNDRRFRFQVAFIRICILIKYTTDYLTPIQYFRCPENFIEMNSPFLQYILLCTDRTTR